MGRTNTLPYPTTQIASGRIVLVAVLLLPYGWREPRGVRQE